jgi:pimeloyl-ACP methyl ester carboxylesterase
MELFYREAMPVAAVRGDILLLHGASFSSSTWAKRVMSPVGAMNVMAAAGYRVVAVDLPGAPPHTCTGSYCSGFVKSKTKGRLLTQSPMSFLMRLIESLSLHRPALISPSASGAFSLPVIVNRPELIGAFVAIAPCCPADNQRWSENQVCMFAHTCTCV